MVLRIPVPIDLRTVARTKSGAFASATPLRVDALVSLAVEEALGARAPVEKRRRVVDRTLRALEAGAFAVDVDGRTFTRPDDVVVADGVVTLRFFANPISRDATEST